MTQSVVIGTALPAEAAETTGSETVEVGEWVSTDTESGSRWGSRLPRKQEMVNWGWGWPHSPESWWPASRWGIMWISVIFHQWLEWRGMNHWTRTWSNGYDRGTGEGNQGRYQASCFELDAYGESVLDVARSYRWEFVRNYDKKFRAAAVGDTSRSWAYLDTSLFTKELTCPHAAYVAANARPAAGLDRQPARKRSKPGSANMEPRGRGSEVEADVCRRFNWQDGQCSFGDRCKYRHICSRCRGQHPVGRCSGQRCRSGRHYPNWPSEGHRELSRGRMYYPVLCCCYKPHDYNR